MPRINLLPWRDEQRKERKLAFMVALGAGTGAAVIAAFGAYLMFGSMISGWGLGAMSRPYRNGSKWFMAVFIYRSEASKPFWQNR